MISTDKPNMKSVAISVHHSCMIIVTLGHQTARTQLACLTKTEINLQNNVLYQQMNKQKYDRCCSEQTTPSISFE